MARNRVESDSEVSVLPQHDTISTSERSHKDDRIYQRGISCAKNPQQVVDPTIGEWHSKCGEVTDSPFLSSSDIRRTPSCLDDVCSTGTFAASSVDLMSEGSDQNFETLESSRRRKKRRCSSEPEGYDIDDAHLDKVADRLEMELSKLESENKQLISCFVTLGEQIQSMKNENNRMSSVISFCNERTAETENDAGLNLFKRSFDASMRDPVALAGISPTVRFLAELALMSGAIPDLGT